MARKTKLDLFSGPLMHLVRKGAASFFQGLADGFVNKIKSYVTGGISLVLAFFFFFFFWLALNVLIVAGLHQFLHWELFFSVLVIALLNLIMTMCFFLAGMNKFKSGNEKQNRE